MASLKIVYAKRTCTSVLRLFGHRLIARRDSGELGKKIIFLIGSLQCRRIFGAGALNNPSLLSSWARKRERAGASQK